MYLFIDENLKVIPSGNHNYLFNVYYEKSALKKCIFEVTPDGSIKKVNHNINMFKDSIIIEQFKNEIRRA